MVVEPIFGILPARQIGGGGGIRTHEGLRPAGFQDRSHQPLDHPSGLRLLRGNCATVGAASKVDRALRRSMMATSAAPLQQSLAERPTHLLLDSAICSCELG